MKILTIIGTRPQFIKASALSKLIKKEKKIREIIVNTGQHYDYLMSNIFFKELKIPKPNYNLNIKSKYHGEMTGKMITGIEKILLKEKPKFTVVYGDTNSTLAGAIASKKLLIPVIHIEAGLRSYNQKMPEEINRILTDNCSEILFAPSRLAIQNLKKEGFNYNRMTQVGDIMYDVFLSMIRKIKKPNTTYDIITTIHRAENTDNKSRILNIIKNLNNLSEKFSILFPIHPRTKNFMMKFKIFKLLSKNIEISLPLSYIHSMSYLKYAKLLITDSGGMQKEALYANTQTLTIRDETEWPETENLFWNRLVKPNGDQIFKKTLEFINFKGRKSSPYGNGDTAKLILKKIKKLK